jgi:hypothetical protein
LQDFGKDEVDERDIMLTEAAEAVRSILRDGIDNAMNQHNKRPNSAETASS